MHFDDFTPGQTFTAGPREISRADVEAFASLSGDRTALHTDETYALSTPFRGIVAHGALVLSVGTGLAYALGIFETTVLALRSMHVSFDRPVFPGESVTLRLAVESREDHPRPDRGRVRFEVKLLNQRAQPVLTGTWELLLRRWSSPAGRDAGEPAAPRPPV